MTKDDVLAHPVIQVTFEVIRLRTLLSALFEDAHADTGLTRMELTALMAVSVAPAPPTVPQIGRSTGHPRQVIQKAANRMFAIGLIETMPNPHHKRAELLRLTPNGRTLADRLLRRGGDIAKSALDATTAIDWERLAADLQALRANLEDRATHERLHSTTFSGGDATGSVYQSHMAT